MPSPFPGMDPYLEAQPFWADLQMPLLTAMKGELKKRIPANYTIWSDIYIWLHEPDAETRLGRPDVLMSSERAGLESNVATLRAPSTSILPAIRREGSRYLKIKEVGSERIVTVIELISPANKAGADREAYLVKRSEYLATGTNLVEIDLLRSGERMPMGEPAPPSADYYVFVCQAADFPNTGIWPFSVRDRLPDISVPLKPEDGLVTLPLQSCFEFAYDQGTYERAVKYGLPPSIPLREEDAEWARERVRQALPGISPA